MSKKSLRKNYIYNLLYQIITLITPLITTPYISRVLKADGIGIVSYTNSVVTYFVLIAVLGTTDYGQREIAYRQDDIKERSRIFWEVFLLRMITGLFSLTIFSIVTRESDNRVIYILQAINIVSVIFDVTWFFQGMEEFGRTVLRNIIVRLLNLICVFVFVKTHNDLPIYIASLAIATLVGHISMWPSLVKFLCKIPLHLVNPFRNIKTVIQLFLPQIAIQVSAVMDKTMLGLITGSDYENGYYEQADRIEKICLTIVSSLGIVMIPRISYVIAKKQEQMVDYYIYRAYRFVWILAIPMTLGLAIIAEQFVPWFFGSGYEKTILLIQIFSVLLCIVGISSVTGVQYFIPAGMQSQFTLSVVLGMIVNFIMNIILIPKMYSVGAAMATVVGELTVTISQLIMVRKRFPIRKIIASANKYLFSSVLMSVGLLVLKNYVVIGIRGTVLLVVIGSIIYFTSLIIIRDEMVKEMIAAFKLKKR